MRTLLLLMILMPLWGADTPWGKDKTDTDKVAVGAIIKAENWKHASGNENNFDIWAVSIKHDAFWKIDLKTGDIYQIGSLGIDISNAGLSFNNKGVLHMLYAVGKNVHLATIDTKTGVATKIVDYGEQPDATIGFEISQNGKHMYWINTDALYEIFMDGTVTKIIDLQDGSWCLSRDKGGKLLAIGIKTRKLMAIDPIKKTVVTGDKLNVGLTPALSLTPGGRQYLCDFSRTIYGIDGDPITLGKIGEICHGFAIINGPKAEK